MLFDIFVNITSVPVAGGAIDVSVQCPLCGQLDRAQIHNARSNRLTCSRCRHSSDQFTNVCPATIDPTPQPSGLHRVGQASVRAWPVDWKLLEPWIAMLGPPEERRVWLPFQLDERGLKAGTLTFQQSVRCVSDNHLVAARSTAWRPCPCPQPSCRNNRLAWWLPPTDILDEDLIACDVRLLTGAEAVVFAGQLIFATAPPALWEYAARRKSVPPAPLTPTQS